MAKNYVANLKSTKLLHRSEQWPHPFIGKLVPKH